MVARPSRFTHDPRRPNEGWNMKPAQNRCKHDVHGNDCRECYPTAQPMAEFDQAEAYKASEKNPGAGDYYYSDETFVEGARWMFEKMRGGK
jgi:hypothetical protein